MDAFMEIHFNRLNTCRTVTLETIFETFKRREVTYDLLSRISKYNDFYELILYIPRKYLNIKDAFNAASPNDVIYYVSNLQIYFVFTSEELKFFIDSITQCDNCTLRDFKLYEVVRDNQKQKLKIICKGEHSKLIKSLSKIFFKTKNIHQYKFAYKKDIKIIFTDIIRGSRKELKALFDEFKLYLAKRAQYCRVKFPYKVEYVDEFHYCLHKRMEYSYDLIIYNEVGVMS